MIIFPAIDLINGKCVRLTEGDFQRTKIYDVDPLEKAKEFGSIGITHLHIIDLDGAKQGKLINIKTIEKIAKNTQLKINTGGGIRTVQDAQSLFDIGVQKIIIGTLAIKEPEIFQNMLNKFGKQKIILAVDVKNEKVMTHGWLKNSEISIYDFIYNKQKLGIKYINCTDISKDGMLEGSNVELYRNLMKKFKEINLTASGGVSSLNELEIFQQMNIYGVIVGKALYEGKITLEDIKNFII